MNRPIVHTPDPKLDLVLERVVDVPRSLIWLAWTSPEHLKKWFTPAPWHTVGCEIDLRPGGIFRTLMQGPDGQQMDNVGCYLEIVPEEKLVWTGALGPGYRPRLVASLPFLMTAILTFESVGNGTKYTALVVHGDEESRDKHDQMGFRHGWSKALDQLVAASRSW
ncbi:MAG TPA: SRPBCC family protein [Steroidobacteraceae bacterium]|nr:SRPBCC family protein [Steroidobacteraceae bacterium]